MFIFLVIRLLGSNIAAFKFKDFSKNDFHFLTGSPAIAAGVDVFSLGINYDYSNSSRSKPYDAGAFAYRPIVASLTPNKNKISSFPSLLVFPNPVSENSDEITLRFFLDKASQLNIKSYDMDGKAFGLDQTAFLTREE